MILSILLVVLLIFLNGFFVAAEFAIVKVRASQLELKLRAGHPLGRLAKSIHDHLDAYLSATQLGITITSLGVGWVGEGAIARPLIWFVDRMGWGGNVPLIHDLSLFLSFFLISVIHIVVGELAPKSLAIQYPVATTFAVAAPLRVFYYLFSPLIWILNHSAMCLIRLLGLQPALHLEDHSVEELRLLLEQGRNKGTIQSAEYDIIKNVFHSTDKIVKQIMVSLPQIEAISVTATLDEVVAKCVQEGFSRYPVFRDNLDNIVGFLYMKDLFANLSVIDAAERHSFVWQEKILKPFFVPETKKVIVLLREFQAKHGHMALVVDEFGSTAGLVTIEDIMEELVGEIQDESDAEVPMVEQTGVSEWRVNGLAPIVLVNQFVADPLPEGDYDTVSGFLNFVAGRIPQVNDEYVMKRYRLVVLRATKRRVELVKITELV